MSIFDPRTWFTKASAAGWVVSSWRTGQAVWTPRNYEAFAKESYVQNAVANRCISLIASGAADVMGYSLLFSGDKEIDSHPVLDLLRNPNPTRGGYEFNEALFSFLLMAGNSYIEAVGTTNGPPKELWTLRPDRMKVIAGRYGTPLGFEYSNDGRRKRWDVNQLNGRGQILHIKEFHPTDDWYGMSRIEPAAYGIDRHNAASVHNKALLDNGARPSGALVFEPVKGAASEGEKPAPKEVVKAAEDALKSRHGGPENAGKPFVFGGNVNWLEMGITPKDMDFLMAKLDAARDICEAFRVPHILIVPGQSTYNNVREAKLALYEEAILPIVNRVVSAYNNWLLPKFGEDLRLETDLDRIPALEPRREALRTSVTTLVDKGIIDTDEARDLMQFGPRPKKAIKKIEPQIITALLDGVEDYGMEPLIRYMRSVGLFDPDMSDEQILARARDYSEEADELDETIDPPGPAATQETPDAV